MPVCASTSIKVPDGGWFPLLVGFVAFTLLAMGPLIRYDAYGEMSGHQSTTIALLDADHNGVVIAEYAWPPKGTTYISNARLAANLTSADLASPGVASITVHTPEGGTSAPAQLTVRTVGPATVTSSLTVPVANADFVIQPEPEQGGVKIVGLGLDPNLATTAG